MDGTIVLGVTGFVVLISLMMQVEKSYGDMIYVRCKKNGRDYRVRNLADKEQAVELLGNIHEKLKKACTILQKNHPTDPRVKRLMARFPGTQFVESDGSGNSTSYSINKGEKIVMCLRSKDGSNRLADENLLLFVGLHELSHIMTKSVGHTEEFWGNFKFVLENVQREGLYKCIDFMRYPQKYCGITVTNTPAPCNSA
jgi:hypothetical protein